MKRESLLQTVRTSVQLYSSPYLEITSEERCTFCLGNCGDLLKCQQVMDVNVIFCFKQNSNYYLIFNTRRVISNSNKLLYFMFI